MKMLDTVTLKLYVIFKILGEEKKATRSLFGFKVVFLGSESVGWDLTPIGIMVRGVALPLPRGEGHGSGFYLVRWRR